MKESAFRAMIFLFVIVALMVVINDIRENQTIVSQNHNKEFSKTPHSELATIQSDYDLD